MPAWHIAPMAITAGQQLAGRCERPHLSFAESHLCGCKEGSRCFRAEPRGGLGPLEDRRSAVGDVLEIIDPCPQIVGETTGEAVTHHGVME